MYANNYRRSTKTDPQVEAILAQMREGAVICEEYEGLGIHTYTLWTDDNRLIPIERWVAARLPFSRMECRTVVPGYNLHSL